MSPDGVCAINVGLAGDETKYVNVTGFAKRGFIHASDFATLMSHNFVCD